MVNLKKFRFDIIIISVLVISLVTWLVLWVIIASNKNTKTKAVIKYDDEIIMELDMSDNTEIELFDLGDGKKLKYKMIIVIENKKVWVEENECPNHDCIKEGKKSKVGDVIVCLPNKVVIKVEKL
jgi:hypothetical protein